MEKITEREILKFERGSYYEGMLSYCIREENDGFWFYGKGMGMMDWVPEFHFRIQKEDIRELEEYILPMKDWPEQNGDFACDAYHWEIRFHDEDLKVTTSGWMKYPEEYRVPIGNLQLWIENLCLTYDPAHHDSPFAALKRVEF